MPNQIFSKKQRMAEDGIIAKVLFYDISPQLRAPAALAWVDAANCYDRVAHAVASLVFRACGSPMQMTVSMLSAIQQMKFFLRTAFGDSDKAVGSRIHLKTQGFMQGNRASPAGWTVVSIAILHAHKQQGHGAQFQCPISAQTQDLSCILYVDDNDLIHMSHNESDSIPQLHNTLHKSITSWGDLLIATGGSLKPAKCFFYLIGYGPNGKGSWQYTDFSVTQNLPIEVPLPDGSTTPIQQLTVHTPSTTLGGSTAPTGTDCALAQLTQKAEDWAHTARNLGLRPRDIPISIARKFCPKLRYGLCANTSPYDDLVAAMHRP